MSAPAMPAFLFEGDTFAVPSWEFRCELPRLFAEWESVAPFETTDLFGVTWLVYRIYDSSPWVPHGVTLISPNGHAFGLKDNGYGAPVVTAGAVRGTVPYSEPKRAISPDEFMHALKAIAERNTA